VLLRPAAEAANAVIASDARKMSIAMRIAHRPGALLASLEPFARHNINLRKIESRPIHGQPWVYQFVLEIEADQPERLDDALGEVRKATNDLRVLGLYAAAKVASATPVEKK
jgi:prephenate dehydratase